MLEVGQKMPFGEGKHVEFKMHTKNMLAEVPRKCSRYVNGRIERTMQPSSKTLCAFLNTDGGTLFMGVNDDLVIRGISMTTFQKDHFYLSLNHCLKSFTPSVPPHLVKVAFQEVHFSSSPEPDISQDLLSYSDVDDDIISVMPEDAGQTRADFSVDSHIIGSYGCSCLSQSYQSQLYLITVQVSKSTDGTVYQNDEGLVYMRYNGSNRMVSIDDLRQMMDTVLIGEPFPPVKYRKRQEQVHGFWQNVFCYFSNLPAVWAKLFAVK